jgi:hypothetical protein
MSTIQDVSAEQLAKLFHHYREALARDFNCQAKEEAPASWDQTSNQERKLMVAAARLALLELAETSSPDDASRKYFAKPGEADWGC